MKYRAEIDGLRALAVVPVILFHAGFEVFSGGFVGVDVFFVISGYLITTVLLEDIENKRLSLISFYERRARRILPALFVVMAACIPFAWMWMLPHQMKDFSQSLVAVSFFASNIFFWRESGYFAATSEEKPLLHTWSLAVEEQYYLLFPIILIIAWRFGKDRVFWTVVVMATISLILGEYGARNHPVANFYLAPTRAWELFAGAIAAFVVQEQGVRKNNSLAMLGLCAVIFSILAYDESTPFPSVYAVLPVLGVVLLLLHASKGTTAARILSNRGFVGIGLISYSAYLWHQPLFAFARIRSLEHPSSLLMSALSVLSIALAYFSWRYVEKPFRGGGCITRNQVFLATLVLAASFTAVGLFGHFYASYFETVWLNRQTPSVQAAYQILNKSHPSSSNWGVNSKGAQDISPCIFNVRELNREIESRILDCKKKYGEGVLVLGDSHAIDLFGVIASRGEQPFLIGVTQGGCRPHDNFNYCHYDRVLDFISSNTEVFGLVIYEQAGFYLLRKANGDKGSLAMFSRLSENEPVLDVVVDEEHVRLTLEFLADIAKVVSVNWFLPRAEPHIAYDIILRRGCKFEYSYRPNLYETFLMLDDYITRYVDLSASSRLKVISQNEMFEFKFPRDFMNCDMIYWSDSDHLSAYGEEYFGRRIKQALFEKE